MMRIEHVGQQTVLSAIVRLLDRAMTEKPRITQLADRVAHHFISALLVGAAIVAAIWTLIEPSAALWITVSVLVVACPCALSLATPAAITAATGYLARRGVLITRGHTLETLAHATHFVFDKTGTLTHGRYELLDVKVVDVLTVAPMSSESNVLHGRQRLNQRPNTRLRALCAMQRPEAGACMPMTWLITLGPASKGASAIGACASAMPLSSPSWQAKPRPTYWTEPTTHPSWPWERQAQLKGQAGSLSFRSAIRYAMKRARSFVRCLTGARSSLFCPAIVRTSCGVLQESWPSLTLIASARPQDKLDYVLRQQAAGDTIVMIGDGVNDAPVLAAASVSIAVGRGTDVARASADAVLLTDRLHGVVEAVDAAGRTLAVIRQNLAWALAYNVAALPLAALGYVTPWMAGIGMALSSLLVVANALRLTRSGRVPRRDQKGQE